MIYLYISLDKEGALTMNHVHLMQCKKAFKHKVDKTMKEENQIFV